MESLAYPANSGIDMMNGRIPFVPRASGQFIELARNCQIRKGRFGTRNRVIEYDVTGHDAEKWHETSTQGAVLYHPNGGTGLHYFGVGRDRIVESASGQLWDLNFDGNDVVPCPIDGATGSQHVYLAWLTQAENYVMRTDRLSKTVIQDGKGEAYYSRGYNRNVPASSSVPNFAGPIVYRKDRIWIDKDGRSMFAGDNLHQQNLVSPIDLKRFTDQSYDYTNVSFAQKAVHGDTVALAQVRIGGIEYVVMMGDNMGMTGVRLDVNREQWKDSDMDLVISDETAAAGPYGLAERDSKLLFRSRRGIESIESVIQEQRTIGTAVIKMGAEIQELLDKDYEPYLAWSSLVNPPTFDQLFCTIQPQMEVDRAPFRRWHEGWVTADFNPTDTRSPKTWAWEGVGVLPDEAGKVVQFLDGRIDRKQRLMAITYKPDQNKKGVVEFTRDRGDDILSNGARKPIAAFLKTKKLTLPSEWRNNKVTRLNLAFSEVKGLVEYRASYRTSEDCKWEIIDCGCGCEDQCGDCKCADEDGEFTDSFKINTDGRGYRWVQFLVEWWGVADVDFAIDIGEASGTNQEGTVCNTCERNQIKIFEYPARPNI